MTVFVFAVVFNMTIVFVLLLFFCLNCFLNIDLFFIVVFLFVDGVVVVFVHFILLWVNYMFVRIVIFLISVV